MIINYSKVVVLIIIALREPINSLNSFDEDFVLVEIIFYYEFNVMK